MSMHAPGTKGHTRNVSSTDERRVRVKRRGTKGPLDLEESPLRPPTPSTSSPQPSPAVAPLSAQPSPALSSMSSPTTSVVQARDYSYLLSPHNFHPLPPNQLPQPFLKAPPPPSASLPELISSLHFRAAAIAAANALSSPSIDPHDHPRIFELWYIRLSCLVLIGSLQIAVQEIKVLSDLSSGFYRDEEDRHIVPWELRVLAVRLQAIAFNDWRRSIGLYYDLAREARAEALKKNTSEETRTLCRRRLEDLGFRVANALVEMGDYAAAGRHLESLQASLDQECGRRVRHMLALLYVKIGNMEAVKECVKEEDDNGREVGALVLMTEGKWPEAVEAWKVIVEEGELDARGIARNNLAVCQLYCGRLQDARNALEGLVDDGSTFPSLIFNLATIYELCGDNARALKMELAEKVAARGRELTNPSFKM